MCNKSRAGLTEAEKKKMGHFERCEGQGRGQLKLKKITKLKKKQQLSCEYSEIFAKRSESHGQK